MTTYRRIVLEEWRENYYHGNLKPTVKKIRGSIERGDIPGKYDGCVYIVYCDNNYEPVWPDEYPQPEEPTTKLTGNPLADQIIMRRLQNA